jgi:hypothetical protein
MNSNRGTRSARAASGAMLVLGIVTLLLAFFYNSMVSAFIGLALAFWGAVLLYARPEPYTRQSVLDASVTLPIGTINQMIQELDYRGDAVYLPPRYFENPENTKIYISRQRNSGLLTPEQVQKHEDKLFARTIPGMLLTPPGAELASLFEKKLETSFTKTDLKYLEQNLPKLLIDDLEIAEDVEIVTSTSESTTGPTDPNSPNRTKNSTVHVKIITSTYNHICRETAQTSSQIGCPLCSAIACAIAKASGKPVTIDKTEIGEDDKTIETTYRVLETTEPQEQATIAPAKTMERSIESTDASLSRSSSLPGFALIALGSIALGWIGWLTLMERTQSLATIFLEPRTGPEGLGIGMRLIYYLLIGLALLLTGVIMLIRRRRTNRNKKPKTQESN